MNSPKVSVIILSYNSRRHLPGLFTTLANQTYSPLEIIVIDNASADDSVAYCKTQTTLPIDRLVENTTNNWFAKGCNQGLAIATGEYVLLCNDDIELEPAYISEVIADMQQTGAAIASGKLRKLTDAGKQQIIDATWLKRYRSGRVVNYGEGELDRKEFDEPKQVFGVSGALMMLHVPTIRSLEHNGELFDESFVAYKEDVDLCWRAGNAGLVIRYVPTAVAYHRRSISKGALSERKSKRADIKAMSYRNHLRMLKKNLTLGEFFLNSPWILSYEVSKFVYLLLREPGTIMAAFKRT